MKAKFNGWAGAGSRAAFLLKDVMGTTYWDDPETDQPRWFVNLKGFFQMEVTVDVFHQVLDLRRSNGA